MGNDAGVTTNARRRNATRVAIVGIALVLLGAVAFAACDEPFAGDERLIGVVTARGDMNRVRPGDKRYPVTVEYTYRGEREVAYEQMSGVSVGDEVIVYVDPDGGVVHVATKASETMLEVFPWLLVGLGVVLAGGGWWWRRRPSAEPSRPADPSPQV